MSKTKSTVYFTKIKKKKKSEVEIMMDFIKLNDEIPICVAATADDLQALKLQISDSLSIILHQWHNI